MGWMSDNGEVNEAAFDEYVASTNLVNVFDGAPNDQICSTWSEMVRQDPAQFFADMDCEDDEDDRKGRRGGKSNKRRGVRLSVEDQDGSSMVIDVAESFGALDANEQEEVRELLGPMAFFKCQRALFDTQCVKMMKGTCSAL